MDGIPTTPASPLQQNDWRLPEIQELTNTTDSATTTSDATIPATSQGGNSRRGVSRRKLLVGAGAGAVGLGLLGSGAVAFIEHQPSGILGALFHQDAAQIGHLLRRAGFGASPKNLETYLPLGVVGTLDKLLNFGDVANAALDARLQALHLDFTQRSDLIRWVVLRMIYSERPFEEKMTLFWHGVLTSSLVRIGLKPRRRFLIQQNQTLRAKCMGRFDDLVHAMTIDPAMLYWLDGRASFRDSPNENYSRELMELFTMGIGNYTQDDVHQGALALTGWIVKDDGAHFVPERHYDRPVTFLGQTGPMAVEDIVRLVCAHPATGMHLARRMWSFFVYDNPSPQDLKPLADAYYQHDHSIAAMVRAMFTAPAFTSAKAYRARVKSPLEFVVGAIRSLGLETDGVALPDLLTTMGQVPLEPPSVAGWPGDGASPVWMSTQTWITRINFADVLVRVAAGGKPPKGVHTRLTSSNAQVAIQQTISEQKIASADDLVRYYVALLLDNTLDASRRAVLADALTKSPIRGGATLTLAGGARISAGATAEMLYLLMSLPEYQMN
ncbi:MAG TPA: DUF1800 domain-containing protein [Ktedonobacterales bacterium]|nr:DUF1800 domain-containing protein [Ktedonobacterales bacterium]